jgi:hypothetical protein
LVVSGWSEAIEFLKILGLVGKTRENEQTARTRSIIDFCPGEFILINLAAVNLGGILEGGVS